MHDDMKYVAMKRIKYFLFAGASFVLMVCAVLCFFFAGIGQGAASFYWVFGVGAGLATAACALMAHAFVIPLLAVLRVIHSAESHLDAQDASLRDEQRHRYEIADYILDLIDQMNLQREQEYSLEILKKQAELDALQSQINPHFLYNTLDSIRGQLMSAGIDDAADTLEALSNLFRYSINPKSVYNTLEQELENINNYMNIVSYRFGYRVGLRVVVDETNSCIYNCEIPKLTLQPIVENAIQHGLDKTTREVQIVVHAYISDQGLHLEISDNGAGISEEILDELNQAFQSGSRVRYAKGTGIALINVNERIRLLHGEPYGLYVNSGLGLGTEVHILLPAQPVSVGDASG